MSVKTLLKAPYTCVAALAGFFCMTGCCGSQPQSAAGGTPTTLSSIVPKGPVVDVSEVPGLLRRYHPVILSVGSNDPVPHHYVATVTSVPIPIVTRAEVAAELGRAGVVILDARTPMEFAGTLLFPPVTRGGHIPGAVNLPVGDLFEGGSVSVLMGRTSLLAVFAAHGVVARDKVVVHCQDGAKSSLVATLLEQSGFSDVDLYYLSFADWQADPNSPVVK